MEGHVITVQQMSFVVGCRRTTESDLQEHARDVAEDVFLHPKDLALPNWKSIQQNLLPATVTDAVHDPSLLKRCRGC